jgi:phosphoglycolate phosphatase
VSRALVIGFDLDMTLVDSRPGIQATIDALAGESNEASLADPTLLDALLRRNRFTPDRAHDLAERFRELYITFGVPGTHLLPGALESLDAVHASDTRSIVITAKYEPNARRCLDHVGLVVDAVFGWRYGDGKAETLREQGACAYVGDTPRDMDAARNADAVPVGVTTGPHAADELRAAGAEVVLSSLLEFPGWWATRAPLPRRAPSDRGG